MNTKNNKRRKESVRKIEKAFIELLQTRELKDVTVSDICKLTGLNRSTFYANFIDIYDLADKMREHLEKDFGELFQNNSNGQTSGGALKMFTHIYENQLLYKTYFKLGYDESHKINIHDIDRAESDFNNKYVDYHIEFFRNGLNAIIKKWLKEGCKETPEEMAMILKQEYRGR